MMSWTTFERRWFFRAEFDVGPMIMLDGGGLAATMTPRIYGVRAQVNFIEDNQLDVLDAYCMDRGPRI